MQKDGGQQLEEKNQPKTLCPRKIPFKDKGEKRVFNCA